VYGIPSDFDPQIFVGATLTTVTFAQFSVRLEFETYDELALTMEGSYRHSGPADAGWHDEVEIPTRESRLMQLAGRDVEAAEVESLQTLALFFSDGQALSVLDDAEDRESFQIQHAERLMIV